MKEVGNGGRVEGWMRDVGSHPSKVIYVYGRKTRNWNPLTMSSVETGRCGVRQCMISSRGEMVGQICRHLGGRVLSQAAIKRCCLYNVWIYEPSLRV